MPCINRSQPVNTSQWENDRVISIRFNPKEPDVLVASKSITSFFIYLFLDCFGIRNEKVN